MVKEKIYDFIDERVMVIYDRTFPLYIIRGEKNYLVDAGPTAKVPEFFKKIIHVLSENAGPGQSKIDALLLTHSHWDHIGGASYLQKRFDFEVMASERTVELLRKSKVIQLIDRMNQGFKALIKNRSDIHFTGLNQLGSLTGESEIPVDKGMELKVFPAPGHTKCSLAYLLTPQKILFPGDAAGLMEPDGTIRPLFFSSYSDYENSIRTLLDLKAEVMALPHNKPIKGKIKVKSFLEASLRKTREVRDTIQEYLAEGRNATQVSELIYEQEFPNISFMGPRNILIMNLESMVRSVLHELSDG